MYSTQYGRWQQLGGSERSASAVVEFERHFATQIPEVEFERHFATQIPEDKKNLSMAPFGRHTEDFFRLSCAQSHCAQ